MKKANKPTLAYSLYIDIVAAIFILLFTYTAVSKLSVFSSFLTVLRVSPWIGSYANFVAWSLPITELIVAGLLFFPVTRIIGLWASLALMVLFTLYLGLMMLFSPDLPCSCGGVLKQLSWKQHLWLNVGLIMLAISASRSKPINKLFIAISRRSRKPVTE